jgi:hypothetical protein
MERNEENAPGPVRIFYAFPAAASSSRVTDMLGRHALWLALVAAFAAAGCGGATTPDMPALVFDGPPALTVPSASGALSIAVWWSPVQPTVGYDAAQLAITDATGAPVTGLALTVVPFMPAHGHGASVYPTISETTPGTYVATPLDFFMAGNWELVTTIASGSDGGGTIDDSAQPTVDVP